VASANGAEVWMRPLADGGRAVVLLNRASRPQTITANWADLGFAAALKLKVRDLWRHEDMGARQGGYSADVAPQSAVMIRVGA
jgi:alpha-galactosidase